MRIYNVEPLMEKGHLGESSVGVRQWEEGMNGLGIGSHPC